MRRLPRRVPRPGPRPARGGRAVRPPRPPAPAPAPPRPSREPPAQGAHQQTGRAAAAAARPPGQPGVQPVSTLRERPRSRPPNPQEEGGAPPPKTDDQRHARLFGVLFIITFITSIAALALFQSLLDDPAGYIAGDGKDNQIYLGAFLEFLLVIANVGTAVVLYPIARRQNEALAIGYVAARIIECVFIAAGIIFVLGVVSLRQDSPDAADLAVSLAQLKDWTFLFGPGLVVPFGNGLILGYLMYKSGLVPRRMAWLGLIGGPLLLIGNIGVLFDWWDQTGLVSLLVIPEFIWEAFLGIYCAIWGFRKDSPILRPAWRGDAAA